MVLPKFFKYLCIADDGRIKFNLDGFRMVTHFLVCRRVCVAACKTDTGAYNSRQTAESGFRPPEATHSKSGQLQLSPVLIKAFFDCFNVHWLSTHLSGSSAAAQESAEQILYSR